MRILVGTDEAGYGPQLGPLVVAATAWEVEAKAEGGGRRAEGKAGDCELGGGGTRAVVRHSKSAIGSAPVDLYRLLRGVVSRSPAERKVAIADSKALYKPGLGLRQLERGMFAVFSAMGREVAAAADGGRPAKMAGQIGTTAMMAGLYDGAARMAGLCGGADCWSELVAGCRADPAGHHRGLAWHDGFNCSLPVDAESAELVKCGAQLARGCEQAGVRPLVVRARLVFPAEFNQLCERYGSKGEALSHVTIGLLREVVEEARTQYSVPSTQAPVFAVCDKHGGRNFYTALLQHHFPEHWVRSVHEGRAESRYEWGDDAERVEIVFRTKGEAFLPTALASMTAKYLRELSMRAFNEFWCARVPNLRPTAGYPGDASRFRGEVTAMQRELGIEDRVMWRER